MLFRFQIAIGAGVLFVLGMPACVGDDPTAPSAPADDASTGDQDGSQSEAGQDQDGAACVTGSKVCVDGTTLGTCGSDATQACPFDCSIASGAHCTVMQPGAPATAADLTTAGVVDLDITVDAFLDTTTGAIDNIRPSNDDPATQQLKSGIGYRLVGNVGVLTVKTLKVESGVTLKLRGASAIAIVASDTIDIIGVVDARAYDATGALCTTNLAGPGGFVGGLGNGAANGSAPGAGGAHGAAGETTGTAAPGGGGFGAAGGDGGGYTTSGGVSVPMPSPIAGGFGGGASGTTSSGYPGGGGGGAVQLVAGTSITIGGGANPGGINAGGCGGTGGAFGQTGSGGGSGGVILLQSPTIAIASSGVLAANGGAGATGNSGPRGGPGQLSSSAALGSAAVSGYGKAGDGSSATSIVGGPGGAGSMFGGGGGGAAGRIRLENRSGSVSLPAGAIVSPVIAIGASAATTVGTLTAK